MLKGLLNSSSRIGGVAQLGERLNGIQEASSSILLISTRIKGQQVVRRLVALFYFICAALFHRHPRRLMCVIGKDEALVLNTLETLIPKTRGLIPWVPAVPWIPRGWTIRFWRRSPRWPGSSERVGKKIAFVIGKHSRRAMIGHLLQPQGAATDCSDVKHLLQSI